VAVLAACDGGATEPPFLPETSPTPTEQATAAPEPTPTAETTPTSIAETATPLPESGGMDGFRAFAARVERALAEGDASFFADRGLEDEMTCAGDEPSGPCLGRPTGAVLRGIPSSTALSDPAALFTSDDYLITLQEWFSRAKTDLSDQYGTGGLVLYALAHQPAGGGTEEAYHAVVTGIFALPGGGLRQARILSLQLLEDTWRLTRELFVTTPHTITNWLSGECDFCYDHWERWEGTP
jgi:hypothetical protein